MREMTSFKASIQSTVRGEWTRHAASVSIFDFQRLV